MPYIRVISAILAGFSMIVSLPVQADIGAIGTGKKANAGKQGQKPAARAAGDTAVDTEVDKAMDEVVSGEEAGSATAKPLLVIRFNQRRMYYQTALRRAIDAAEDANPNVYYHVISYVSTGGSRSKNLRLNEDSQLNLSEIVGAIQERGVPASRIETSTQTATDPGVQEIHVYVNTPQS